MEEAIDFPCAPGWTTLYARQGLCTDYPDELYDGDVVSDLQRRVVALEEENSLLRSKMSGNFHYNQLRAQTQHLQQQLDGFKKDAPASGGAILEVDVP